MKLLHARHYMKLLHISHYMKLLRGGKANISLRQYFNQSIVV